MAAGFERVVHGGDAGEGLRQCREEAAGRAGGTWVVGRACLAESNPHPEAEGGAAEPSLPLRSHLLELLGHWSPEVIARLLRILKPRGKLPECQ